MAPDELFEESSGRQSGYRFNNLLDFQGWELRGDDNFVLKLHLHNNYTTFLIFVQKHYPKIGNEAKKKNGQYLFFPPLFYKETV